MLLAFNHMKHNHAAIWLLVFAQLILTVIWRSPLLFYSVWIEEQGRKMQSAPQEDNLPFVTAVLSFIILNYFLSWLIQTLKRDTFKKGVVTGLILFGGLIVPILSMHYKLLDISNLVLLIDLGLSGILVVFSSGLLAVWRVKESMF
jgi:hypothetical protein